MSDAQQDVICLDESASEWHIYANAKNVAMVQRVWVGIFDFVCSNASAGAIDVLEDAFRLLCDDWNGIVGRLVVCAATMKTRSEVGLRQEDGRYVRAMGF